MRILVAGGAGYVGSCCTHYLLNHGHDVVVYDSLVKGHRAAVDPRAAFVQGDIGDATCLEAALKRHRAEGVVHFAGFIEVGESMIDPGRYFRNNVAAALSLLESVARCDVRKIVFSSTAAVYGTPETVPIPETSPKLPINAYGESKLMFERILGWFHQVHGLEYAALRYFNACGATDQYGEDHDPETHLIPIVFQAVEGKRDCVHIYGDDYNTPDGTCIRDYVHVLDLAQAHLLALEGAAVGSFNLGSGAGHSVREVIDMVEAVTGHTVPARPASRRAGDPPRLISDSAAARMHLGWKPCHDNLRETIENVWIWRRQHPNGY